MKTNNTYSKRKRLNLIYGMLLTLLLSGFLSPVSASSISTSVTENSSVSNTTVNTDKIVSTNPQQIPKQNKHTRKQVLIGESRGMSAFFILGIAINIVMAMTFAWWFSREWRKSKK